MKIEAGKFYRTRSGRVAEITEIYPVDEDGTDPYNFPVIGKIDAKKESWTRGGSWYSSGNESNDDLIAEIDGGGEGIVEAGGCAPPVSVNGPVADVYDAMGDRPKPPVEHIEPEFTVGVKFGEAERPSGMAVGVAGEMLHAADIDTEFNPYAGRKGDSGPHPHTLTIPIGNMTEIDLMGALETVMQSFVHQHEGLPTIAKVRAADWFHAKYGTPR